MSAFLHLPSCFWSASATFSAAFSLALSFFLSRTPPLFSFWACGHLILIGIAWLPAPQSHPFLALDGSGQPWQLWANHPKDGRALRQGQTAGSRGLANLYKSIFLYHSIACYCNCYILLFYNSSLGTDIANMYWRQLRSLEVSRLRRSRRLLASSMKRCSFHRVYFSS